MRKKEIEIYCPSIFPLHVGRRGGFGPLIMLLKPVDAFNLNVIL